MEEIDELIKKMNNPTERERKVAEFLEDMAREDDKERELYPSLERFPKREDSWTGWMHSARKLLKLLDE